VQGLAEVLVKSIGTYVLPAAAPPCATSTCAVSADEEHPEATVPPGEAVGEEPGDAGAVLGAVAPPGEDEPPDEAEFAWTGPQAAVSAPVASNAAAPRS
jgi:hypothetical protein